MQRQTSSKFSFIQSSQDSFLIIRKEVYTNLGTRYSLPKGSAKSTTGVPTIMRLREKVQTPRRFDEEDYSRRRSNINPCAAVPFPELMRNQITPFDPDLPPAAFPSLPLKGITTQHPAETLHEDDEPMQDVINTDASRHYDQAQVLKTEAVIEVEAAPNSSDGEESEAGSFTLDTDEVIIWTSLELSVQYRIFVNLYQHETPRGAAIRLRISELDFLNIRRAIARRLQIPEHVDVLWRKLHNVEDASAECPEPSTVTEYADILLEAGSYDLAFPISIQKGLKFLDDRYLDRSLLGYWSVNDDGFAQALPDLSNIARQFPIQPVYDSGYSSENEAATDADVVVVNTDASLAGTLAGIVKQQRQKQPVVRTDADHDPTTVFRSRQPRKQQKPEQLDPLEMKEADIEMPDVITPSPSRSTSISSGAWMSPTIHIDDQPAMTGVTAGTPDIEQPSASEERSAGSMRLRGSSSLKSTDKMKESAASEEFWAQGTTTSEGDHTKNSSQESTAASPSLTVVLKYDPAKLVVDSIERDSPIHGPVLEERGPDGMWRPVSTVAFSHADTMEAGNETSEKGSSTGFMTPVRRLDQDMSRGPTTVPVKPEPDRVLTVLSEDLDMTDTPTDSNVPDNPQDQAPQSFAMKLVDSSVGVDPTKTPDVRRLGIFGSNEAHPAELEDESVGVIDASKPNDEAGDTSSSPASSPLQNKGQAMALQHQPPTKPLVAGTGTSARPLVGTSTMWKAPPSRRNSASTLAKKLDRGFSMPPPNSSPISSPEEIKEDVVPHSAPPTAASFAPGVRVLSNPSTPATRSHNRSSPRNLRSNAIGFLTLKIGSPRHINESQVSSLSGSTDNIMAQESGPKAKGTEPVTPASNTEKEPNANTTSASTSTDKPADDKASLSKSLTEAPKLRLTMRKTRSSTAPAVDTSTQYTVAVPDADAAAIADRSSNFTSPSSHRLSSALPVLSPPKTRARSRRVQSETPENVPNRKEQVSGSNATRPSLLKSTLSKRAQNVTLTAGKKQLATGRKPDGQPRTRGNHSTVKTRAAGTAEKTGQGD